jgi:hypothetical protein
MVAKTRIQELTGPARLVRVSYQQQILRTHRKYVVITTAVVFLFVVNVSTTKKGVKIECSSRLRQPLALLLRAATTAAATTAATAPPGMLVLPER